MPLPFLLAALTTAGLLVYLVAVLILCEQRVNVLELNLSLDRLARGSARPPR